MAKSRLTLQAELEEVFESRNVYYQPPENFKMEYPCIRYEDANSSSLYADNRNYLYTSCYSLQYIHRDPDSPMTDKIRNRFQMIRQGPRYIADNLYHDTFTLYY